MAGDMTTFAGSGEARTIDGNGINASFNKPHGISVNQESGEMYVVEVSGQCIRKLSLNGIFLFKGAIFFYKINFGFTGNVTTLADVDYQVNTICFHPLQNCLFATGHNRRIVKYDLQTGKCIWAS